MKNKVRRKPTAKEMASAIIEINSKVNECYARTQELDNVLGLYIEMNKDVDKFNSYIQQKIDERKKASENDQEKNGSPDKSNLQGDTGGKGSGSKRVRKKSK